MGPETKPAIASLLSLAVFKQFEGARTLGKLESRNKERESREEPGRETIKILTASRLVFMNVIFFMNEYFWSNLT